MWSFKTWIAEVFGSFISCFSSQDFVEPFLVSLNFFKTLNYWISHRFLHRKHRKRRKSKRNVRNGLLLDFIHNNSRDLVYRSETDVSSKFIKTFAFNFTDRGTSFDFISRLELKVFGCFNWIFNTFGLDSNICYNFTGSFVR